MADISSIAAKINRDHDISATAGLLAPTPSQFTLGGQASTVLRRAWVLMQHSVAGDG